jgi:hypothetical protein
MVLHTFYGLNSTRLYLQFPVSRTTFLGFLVAAWLVFYGVLQLERIVAYPDALFIKVLGDKWQKLSETFARICLLYVVITLCM